jgi:predicted alpha/beta superfamily hydrolase
MNPGHAVRRAIVGAVLLAAPVSAQTLPEVSAAPLVIGETFTFHSSVLGEARRINVYAAAGYDPAPDLALPVLYMPDGGIGEDFLHVAGAMQISALNGTMRPFLLVGIENTQRRRDLTGPTESEEDRRIAPVVGGSAAFRRFIRTELMPLIRARYRTTDERAIMGESLAGLFVVETFMVEPELFDTYIAFDPSLWWDGARLVAGAPAAPTERQRGRTLYLAHSSQAELAELTTRFADALAAHSGVTVHRRAMPDETHATIYHPAALGALRQLFKPASVPQ